MKILFASFSYFPETSGVPIVVKYLAEGLYRKGHSVSVVTRKNGKELASKESINGVIVYRFDFGQNLFKKATGDFNSYIHFVTNFDKDVLVLECLQCQTTDILLPHLSKMDCKVILHTHGAPGIRMKPFGWEGDLLHTIGHTHNWLRWKLYYLYTFPKYCSGIYSAVCLSLCSSDLSYLSHMMDKVCVVENAADDFFFDNDYQKKDVSTIFQTHCGRYIVNISNYSDRKNQKLLIKEFCHANINDCALVLIGSQENAYCKLLKKRANKLSKKGNEIIILHSIDRRYFPAIIKNASLFIMTSKWEEYPVSLVEAMAVGTAFISTPVGNSHILPGGVTSRENRELRSLIRVFINNDDLTNKYGTLGKLYSSKFNRIGIVIDEFEKILQS